MLEKPRVTINLMDVSFLEQNLSQILEVRPLFSLFDSWLGLTKQSKRSHLVRRLVGSNWAQLCPRIECHACDTGYRTSNYKRYSSKTSAPACIEIWNSSYRRSDPILPPAGPCKHWHRCGHQSKHQFKSEKLDVFHPLKLAHRNPNPSQSYGHSVNEQQSSTRLEEGQ